MNQFIEKFATHIKGVLTGFDRLVLRGHLRQIVYSQGLLAYLWDRKVLLKHFGRHVEETSRQIKQASLEVAKQQQRPCLYLQSSQVSKEETAQKIAVQDKVEQGLICALSCVEPCMSFEVIRNAQSQELELRSALRKCLHVYHYWKHPQLGFLYARLQTWFPFSVQIGLNGREWLARTMDQQGMKYQKQDNCFTWIEDYAQAQKWMDEQLKADWPQLLNTIAEQLNPVHQQIFSHFPLQYYWSVYQSEWAMDLGLDPEQLRRLYPKLLRLGMTCFSCSDVLRFLGKKPTLEGQVPANLLAQVTSDLRRRREGVRIKHFLGANSIKLYDKAYTERMAVLRPEFTMNDPSRFLVYRPKEGGDPQDLQWRTLRRGIADIYQRAQVCQKALNRYCDALASVDDSSTLEQLIHHLERRVQWQGHPVRALHPFACQDQELLQSVNRGEFTLHGFRNADLRALLYATPATSPREERKRSSAVSRKLRLLRAHGLIQKLPHTYRYQVTEKGRQIINAVLAARHATVNHLLAQAA